MDPNATLKEIRRVLNQRAESSRDETIPFFETAKALAESEQEDLEHLAELISALDEWLSKGGFLPAAWQQAHAQIRVECNRPPYLGAHVLDK